MTDAHPPHHDAEHADRSLVLAMVAVPLWLASLSWVPFVMAGAQVPGILGAMLPILELSGLAAAIVLGRRARRRASGDRTRARARWAVWIGTTTVSVGMVLNLVGLTLAG